MLAAYFANPERFIQGPPRPRILQRAVYTNRPVADLAVTELAQH